MYNLYIFKMLSCAFISVYSLKLGLWCKS